MDEVTERCIKEYNLTRQELIDEKSGRSQADQRIKCFYACHGKIAGWLTNDGELIRDKLFKPLSKIPKEHWPAAEAFAQTCLKKSEDPCDTAFFVQKCIEAQTRNNK
ncbi:uncharacterized protein [Chelonus insularis]|nr:uncharacterized protein LOC118073447 isoform X2 [Chelonus insularis]